ncbi:MAG: ABC transporter substrate-binding protein [Chloroflexi bacterium]|nr:MAG: ABC transporter substrate-binding protein [Chloroflexota bacterium]
MKHILLLAAFVLAACGTPTTYPAAVPTATPLTAVPAPTATVVMATATPVPLADSTLTDSAGRTVVVKQPVRRIVSLAPSTTEIVAALDGLERLIAIDMYSDFPTEVSALPKITNPDMSVDYEQITASAPDVVFAAGITAPDVIAAIEKLGIPVVIVGAPTATFASVLADIRLVGTALQRDTEAQMLTGTMQTEWQALADKVAKTSDRPTVFWELDATDPAKPYTVGPDSFVAELLQVAGGTNIFADVTDAYPQVSLEQIVAKAPDTIILADSLWGVTPESVVARAGWDSIPAVQNQRVFPIDDNIVSRPGPRIVQGLQAVVAILHPELK